MSFDPGHPNPTLAPLVDSHAHLDSEEYNGEIEAVLERARAFGVVAVLTVGIEPQDWAPVVALASSHHHEGVHAAAAVHPNSAGLTDDTSLAALDQLCRDGAVVAIGETGLDYFREYVSPEEQRKSFRAHLAMAREHGLPVIIHNRDAHRDIFDILKSDGAGTFGVMHSFSGDLAYALECIELGYMISLAGPVTFRKATDKHEVARAVPLDRLLIETDCPYLTPDPFRGRRNEPAYVAFTARAVAQLRGISLEELAHATTENAARLFNITPAAIGAQR